MALIINADTGTIEDTAGSCVVHIPENADDLDPEATALEIYEYAVLNGLQIDYL